jgi:hypothetical protein
MFLLLLHKYCNNLIPEARAAVAPSVPPRQFSASGLLPPRGPGDRPGDEPPERYAPPLAPPVLTHQPREAGAADVLPGVIRGRQPSPGSPHRARARGTCWGNVPRPDERTPRLTVIRPPLACPLSPLRSLCDLHESPERRAARHGYRIDASRAWVGEGKASVAPHLPRFAVGHRRTPEEEREACALRDRIRTYCAQAIDLPHAVNGPEETRSLTVNESRGRLPGSGPGARGLVARSPGASARAVGVVPPRS